MTTPPNTPLHAPAWAETTQLPVTGPVVPPPAGTLLSPVDVAQPDPVQLRVFALHFALKMVGERGSLNQRDHNATVRRLAAELERELYTGNWLVPTQ